MITCKQAATLLTSGEIERQSAWRRWEVRFHLWMCKNCSRLARQLEQIHQAGRELRSMFESEKPAGDPDGMVGSIEVDDSDPALVQVTVRIEWTGSYGDRSLRFDTTLTKRE